MILYFIIFISWLAGLFLIGSLVSFIFLNSRFNPNPYELILRNTFLGYLLIIVGQSVISSGLKTVNIIFILLLLFTWIEIRKYKLNFVVRRNNFNVKFIFALFLTAALFYIYSWFLISDPDGFLKFTYDNNDYILYGKISKFISNTGKENAFNVLNTMDKFYNWHEPYHYFDIWGAALVSNVYGINNYLSLELIIYPTFYFLYTIGILALIVKYNLKSFVLAFALIMVGGITFAFNTNINFLDNLVNISLNLLHPNFSKLSYIYVFAISSFLLYKNDLLILSFLCILSLAVATIIALPSIVPVLLLILIFGYFTKILKRQIAIRSIIYLVLTSFSFVFFYSFLNKLSLGFQGAEINSASKFINDNLKLINFITQRNIILASILGIIIIYLPFILAIIFNRRLYPLKEYKNNIPSIFIVSVFLMSLLVWCFLFAEINSRQLHQNISIPLLNVAFSIYILNFLNKSAFKATNRFSIKHIPILLILILITQNIYTTIRFATERKPRQHSFEYLSQIKNKLIPNSIVASLKGADLMTEIDDQFNIINTLGDYLFLMDKNVYPVNVGDLDTPIDSSSSLSYFRSKKAVRDGLFLRYSQFPENTLGQKDEVMLKFLKEYNIKQMIVSKNAHIPDTLLFYVKNMVTDSISNERFIWFNL